jgi:hypothetical protein
VCWTDNSKLLDLVFSNCDNLEVTFVDMGMVKADVFYRHMVIGTDFVFCMYVYIYI